MWIKSIALCTTWNINWLLVENKTGVIMGYGEKNCVVRKPLRPFSNSLFGLGLTLPLTLTLTFEHKIPIFNNNNNKIIMIITK